MKSYSILFLAALSFPFTTFAEGKDPAAGFLASAAEYDNKAALAEANGKEHNANIFRKLAAIKRDAASKAGEGYDWSEYHELKKQLRFDGNKNHKGKDKPKNKNKGNSFIDAASKYDAKARAAKKAGDHRTAKIYRKLASIKRKAARSDGNFDWSEYHQLKAKLHNNTPPKKDNNKGVKQEDVDPI